MASVGEDPEAMLRKLGLLPPAKGPPPPEITADHPEVLKLIHSALAQHRKEARFGELSDHG